MTQRSKLDALSRPAGRVRRRRLPRRRAVARVETRDGGVRVRANGDTYEARCSSAPTASTASSARALGLAPASEHAVALEANYPADAREMERWQRFIALDLGGIPGGYGWVFPKGDHLNVGVGGWKSVGPDLRRLLTKFCRYYGFDESTLFAHRGYQLPLRSDDQPVVRGAAMLAGDAAALVDPLSGEGIWAAFVSGRLAAEEAQRYLARRSRRPQRLPARARREMREEILASRRLMAIFQRLPAFSVLMLKYNGTFWRYLTEIIRGDITYPDLPKKLGPLRHLMYRWADHEIARHQRDLARAAAK